MTGPDVDLSDPGLFATGDPHAAFARLRDSPGLYWNRERSGPGYWAVTRYADAVAVYRDTASFTSTRGTILGPNRGAADPAGGRMLVMTDPPYHGRLRAVLGRGFTPRIVQRLERRLEAEVRVLLERAVRAGRCDFVADVAARVPVVLICEMMGVPQADWELMYRLTSAAFSSDVPEAGASAAAVRAASAHAEILGYYANLLAHRRRDPREDLVSVLATAEVEGRRLSDRDVLLNCDNLIVGGNETTRHAAAGGLLALVQHPGQLERLRGDPALLEAAVEEVLRWTTPGMHVLRTAAAGAVVGGQSVGEGQQVVVWNISANRDEPAFPDAGAFDVGRRPNRHLAFGVGEHFCLGAALARMELRILFGELAARVASVELLGPAERLRSSVVCGLRRLPVALRPG